MNKLFVQLTKELKRSPTKAAVLGGGTLLAIWFWFPLITSWLGLGESGDSNVPLASAPAAEAPSLVTTPAETTAPTIKYEPIDWRAVAQWRETHPQATTFVWTDERPDPFRVEEPVVETVVAESTPEESVDEALTNELAAKQMKVTLAGLRLTSTLITSKGRAATINGKVYREGEPIELNGLASQQEVSGTADPQVIRLKHVAARSVTLQQGSELIPLELSRSRSTSIQLEFR